MQFAGKIPSIWDEVSWRSDSFLRNSLYKIQAYTYVRGSIEPFDLQDYYFLDLSAGQYTLFVTTDGLNTPSVFNTSFKTEIVDAFGSVVLGEDTSHPDLYTDQISFTYNGTGDFYLKISSITADFDYRAAVYTSGAPITPGSAGNGQLYLNPGNLSYGPVPGGDLTKLFGSNLPERVTLAADANVLLDPSFVRGNDVLVILGDSSDYTASSSVAGVTVTSSNGAHIRIPAFGNGGGIKAQFNDTALQLITKDGGNTFNIVEVTVEPVESTNGRGQLFLNPGNLTYGPVPGDDLTQIFGSNLTELVTLASNANAALDPSFVRGNDLVVILGDAGDYDVSANVAGITISSDNGAQVRIPAFGADGGLMVQFNNGTVLLDSNDGGNSFQLVGAGKVQEITGTAAAIMTFA
jgi:hypothetical protein